jgi:uncharacterized repeat protein (TIGR03837 family)
MIWDIFCKVIDNHGDIGVCWRLSADLAAHGEQVRLWVDEASALQWMAPSGCKGLEVRAWTQPLDLTGITAGDILLEAFGCDLAPEIIANYAYTTRANGLKPWWINLEYLSAEVFARRNHGLPSPVMSGPGAGLTKHFFYPGFFEGTGSLLREENLPQRQAAFDSEAWLGQFGITVNRQANERLVSLFCYEPPALEALLDLLAQDRTPTRLLVTSGRAANAVSSLLEHKNRLLPSWNINSSLSISYLPALTQIQYDELLWACDLNFVRGEDSLVRAIWAGKAFVWQIYPQSDDAHHAKLEAFLDMLAADPALRRFHHVWNALETGPLPALALADWQTTTRAKRAELMGRDSLTTQLLGFVAKKR